MKVCNDYYLLINLYIDGELEGEDARRVEEHLQACPACRRYCDEICMVNRAVQDVSYPKDLHHSIMAAVDAERAAAQGNVTDFPKSHVQPVQKKHRSKGRWIGTVAAMLAVACVGVFGMQGGLTSIFSGVKTAETAADSGAVMEETVTESANETVAEQKSAYTMTTKDAEPEALEMPTAQGQQPIRIEELMTGWFTDTADHVTMLDNGAAMNIDLPDESGADTLGVDGNDTETAPEEGAAETQILTEAQLEALAALLGEGADGYGFYLVTAGAAEKLPAVFADQEEAAGPGSTLVITVRNDADVRVQILASLSERNFEVYEDDAQVYFAADPAAEEGLVIALLTE